MVFTRKFSQFVPQAVASVVGLTTGANSIGPGSGGGATVTYTFDQPTAVVPPLYLGAAVRVDVASGLWECTLATTTLLAEFYAFIVGITGTTYTVQFAGPVPDGIPFITGLLAGTPYYLSDTVAGGITATPTIDVGEVNLPVLWGMDNGKSVIKMSRGFINGDGSGGGGGGGSPNNVATVNQPGNTFALGDVLYLLSDQVFAKANAYTTLAASQAEWMVTSIIVPGTSFTIQQGGQVQGLVVTDDVGAAITSGPIYYVSPIAGQEGKLTKVNPAGVGLFSKPFYVQQVLGSATGWLLDQRPVNSYTGNPNASPWILMGQLNEGNNFSSDTILIGDYHSFWVLFSTTTSALQVSDGGAPSGIGLQIRSAGVWVPLGASAYMDGVNSTAGVNTATWWGYVRNTISPNSALIVPPLVNKPELGAGFAYLTTHPGFGNISGEIDFANYGIIPTVGYTCDLSSAISITSVAQGLRLVVEGPGAFIPGSGFYITVYGIPNS